MPAALLFDLDGVLVETEGPTLSILHEELAALGSGWSEEAVFQHFCGRNLDCCDADLRHAAGGTVPSDFVRKVRERFDRESLPLLHAQPGAASLLSRSGLPVRVVTNSDYDSARRVLMATQLWNLIGPSDLIVALPGDHLKPAPDLYRRAVATVNAKPSACWAVEDSVVGLRAARAAGVHAIAYAPTGRGAPDGYPSIATLEALCAVAQIPADAA